MELLLLGKIIGNLKFFRCKFWNRRIWKCFVFQNVFTLVVILFIGQCFYSTCTCIYTVSKTKSLMRQMEDVDWQLIWDIIREVIIDHFYPSWHIFHKVFCFYLWECMNLCRFRKICMQWIKNKTEKKITSICPIRIILIFESFINCVLFWRHELQK